MVLVVILVHLNEKRMKLALLTVSDLMMNNNRGQCNVLHNAVIKDLEHQIIGVIALYCIFYLKLYLTIVCIHWLHTNSHRLQDNCGKLCEIQGFHN